MNKWMSAGFLAAVFVMAGPGSASEVEHSLSLPPESLARWYKPANERQVWLHNMFKLRREMQAATEYLESGDLTRARKWIGRLASHYGEIAEMVPEWEGELFLTESDGLLRAAQEGDLPRLRRSLRKIRKSCDACHREYRALSALDELEEGLSRLGESCGACHKDEAPRERLLGTVTREALVSLRRGIEQGDTKLTGRSLGSAAVFACARCHAVHRTGYEVGQLIDPAD